MVADTKKKRGRPKSPHAITFESVFPELSTRAAQNVGYAGKIAVGLLKQGPVDFFITSRGSFRRQSIAEQIGRMYSDGLITEDQARDLAREAMQDYESGATVKEIVKTLSTLRQVYKRARA